MYEHNNACYAQQAWARYTRIHGEETQLSTSLSLHRSWKQTIIQRFGFRVRNTRVRFVDRSKLMLLWRTTSERDQYGHTCRRKRKKYTNMYNVLVQRTSFLDRFQSKNYDLSYIFVTCVKFSCVRILRGFFFTCARTFYFITEIQYRLIFAQRIQSTSRKCILNITHTYTYYINNKFKDPMSKILYWCFFFAFTCYYFNSFSLMWRGNMPVH
jgi:hypothetical protein